MLMKFNIEFVRLLLLKGMLGSTLDKVLNPKYDCQ